MAKTRCVAVKCVVKDIFDKALKPAVLKQIEKTVQNQVDKNKSKGLVFDQKCKDGWLLTATVVSLKLNDPKKPTGIEAKVAIDGVPLQGTAKGFKASGSAKATGINSKKLEQEATLIVNDALEDLLAKKAMPHITSRP